MKYSLRTFFAIMLMAGELLAKRKMFNIFWNTTSPMFRIDNTDHIVDINSGNHPWEYDQANLICPVYPRGTRESEMERYIIYAVSKDEYENCRITSPAPKIVAMCDAPYELTYITVTFRSFTPTPGGLEFRPGHDYYFISTSSRADLHRRVGGRCSTHNMKVMFKVAPVEYEREPAPPRSVNVPRRFEDGLVKDNDYPSYPYEEISEVNSNSLDHDKRSEDYDALSHPNEVAKQASVMHPDSSSSRSVGLSVVLMATLSVILRTL